MGTGAGLGSAAGAVAGGVVVVGISVITSSAVESLTEVPKEHVKIWVDNAADFYVSPLN